MNSKNHESSPFQEHHDEIARRVLAYPDFGEIIMFTPSGGVDKMRFIKTGETELVTYKVGDSTMSFEREVEEPIIYEQFGSLEEYAAQVDGSSARKGGVKDNLALFRNGFKAEHDSKYDDLRLVVREAAAEMCSSHEDMERIAPCSKACTDGMVVSDCECVVWGRGSSYTDLSGETIKSADEKTPKEDCSGCNGMGVRPYRCGECLGAGIEVSNPFITAINNINGETTSFRADIAYLIANGFIDVDINDDRMSRSTNKNHELRIGFDATELMVAACEEVGIDLHKDDIVTYWGGRPIELFATSLAHLAQPVATTIEQQSEGQTDNEHATAILGALQKRLLQCLRIDIYSHDIDIHRSATDDQVKSLATKFDLFMNDDMTVSNYGLRLELASSIYDKLQEIINLLAERNYRLGYAMTGVATGERGPGLYVMDASGNILQELDSGYEIEIVLQNSLSHVRAAQ